MLVRRAEMLPIECIVRGYITGSAWKEYQEAQTMHGAPLPAGLLKSARLPEPVFTPSTKATEGHDENISFEQSAELVGDDVAKHARDIAWPYQRGGRAGRPSGASSSRTPSSSWGSSTASRHLRRDPDPRFQSVLAGRQWAPAPRPPRSTSSRFVTGQSRPGGTRNRRRHRSRRGNCPDPPALHPAYEKISGRRFGDWPGAAAG